jgi:cytochrome c oxidase assembly protein subunit 15
VAVGAAAVTGVVLILGTLLTAAGPHAGDENVQRLGLDIRTFAVAHADAVWLLVGLTIAGLAVSMASRQRTAITAFAVLLALELVQGAVGYVQYVTGIPAELVGVHILGSMLVWAAAVHAAVVTGSRP